MFCRLTLHSITYIHILELECIIIRLIEVVKSGIKVRLEDARINEINVENKYLIFYFDKEILLFSIRLLNYWNESLHDKKIIPHWSILRANQRESPDPSACIYFECYRWSVVFPPTHLLRFYILFPLVWLWPLSAVIYL